MPRSVNTPLFTLTLNPNPIAFNSVTEQFEATTCPVIFFMLSAVALMVYLASTDYLHCIYETAKCRDDIQGAAGQDY